MLHLVPLSTKFDEVSGLDEARHESLAHDLFLRSVYLKSTPIAGIVE